MKKYPNSDDAYNIHKIVVGVCIRNPIRVLGIAKPALLKESITERKYRGEAIDDLTDEEYNELKEWMKYLELDD